MSSTFPYLWLQITELQGCLHIRVPWREVREQGGSLEKAIKGSRNLCVETQWSCSDSTDVDPAPCPGLCREISAVQCSFSRPTGVARGTITLSQLLHIRGLVLELQPVKMLSQSKTFEKGLSYFNFLLFPPYLSVGCCIIQSWRLSASLQLLSMLFIILIQTSAPTLAESCVALLLNCWN